MNTSKFPVVNWVTTDDGLLPFTDYRPAVGPDGQMVVFERTYQNDITQLYVVKTLTNNKPEPFLPKLNDRAQTRPDWNWAQNRIAFNLSDGNVINVWMVNAEGDDLAEIENTAGYFYPQWAALAPGTGNDLIVMNNHTSAPKSTRIGHEGVVSAPNMNGEGIFGGMPAVFPGQSTFIAFAGQPYIINWGGTGGSGYNENYNYIFLNAINGHGIFSSAPMEPFASLNKFDPDFQGRAPAISPDGRYVAFESNRIGGGQTDYSIYLFDLFKPGNKAIRLTDPSTAANAQHAKFFADGRRLVFGAINPAIGEGRIAWIDIPEYL